MGDYQDEIGACGEKPMGACRWCADGPPEWSYDAKVWIHRRERLDKRCENPPNGYGYTRQVPEETVTGTIRGPLRRGPTSRNQRGMGSIDFTGLLWLGLVIGAILGVVAWALITYLLHHVTVGWE